VSSRTASTGRAFPKKLNCPDRPNRSSRSGAVIVTSNATDVRFPGSSGLASGTFTTVQSPAATPIFTSTALQSWTLPHNRR
jgi:hypothetical protein